VNHILRSRQRSVVALAHSFRFDNNPVIHSSIIVAFALLLASACFPASAQAQADITVDIATSAGTVNPLLFGNNVPYAGNAGMLWDVRTNDLQAGAKPFVQTIAPTVLRFPGGSITDVYMWEDGLGYKTTAPVSWGASSVNLEAVPDWGTVSSAVFLDRTLTEEWWLYGDAFTFTGITGTQLQGVSGIDAPHLAGVEVRPGPRQGQDSWFSNQYGIDEHMKLVTSLGAQAIITVNYGTGRDRTGAVTTTVSLSQKVNRAAAWVAYLNGRPGDTRPIGVDEEGHDWQTVGYWAQKRADRGHPAPYNVIYWEISNEAYGSWEAGYAPVRKYANDFIVFATTMKTIDPAIKVGAVTWSEPHFRGDADSVDEWAPTLVRLAGDALDFLIVHLYYPAAYTSYASPTWFTATMAAAHQAIANLTTLRAVIAANSSRAGQIELVVTEYGILPLSGGVRDYSNLAGSLYDADLLMAILQHPELNVTLATAWTLHDSSTELAAVHFDWSTGSRWARPQYYALELMRNYLAPTLRHTSVTSPTFGTAQVGNVQYTPSIPTLGALASTNEGGRLSLLVLNRGDAVDTSIHLQAYTPQPTATVRTLTGDSLAAQNEENHSAVILTTNSISSAATTFSYTFPAHSLTMIEFQGTSPPPSAPTPTTSGISPTSTTALGTAFTLTIDGTNFDSSAQVKWNGSARTTTYVSATQVTAPIPASDLATAGTATVTVTTTGGTSNGQTFTINNPTPPTAVISAKPLSQRTPRTVTFDGSRSHAAGNAKIAGYNWNMGDGSTMAGMRVSYTYASPGTYTATLAVTDSAGLTGTASMTMRIKKR
jgi:alpha-N-arabinofuranosidase